MVNIKSIMNQQFLSTTDLAKLLGVSRVTVFKKIKKGEIKAIRIGRNFAIDKKYLSQINGQVLTKKNKQIIDRAVKKTVNQYGETLRLLGKE